MARAAEKADLGAVVRKEPIRIGITAPDREKVATALSDILGATYRLIVKSHVYHWNVVGPLFKPVHELTEAHYENLFKAADEIAERVRSLGFPSPHGSKQTIELGVISIERIKGTTRHMIEDLIADHEALTRAARDAAKTAEDAEDFASHDLLVSRLAFHEKAIWMLRATAAE